MPVHNSDIAYIFQRVADFLEIEGESTFRVRAYRNAARIMETLPNRVEDMVQAGADLTELPGIGKDLAGKINEIVETGHLRMLDELESKLPASLAELLTVPGLGPRRVHTLYQQLDITNLEELRRSAEKGEIHTLPGFGEKIEKNILSELERRRSEEKRLLLAAADEIAVPLARYMQETPGVKQVEVAGSYRRRKETVGDLDILATGEEGRQIVDAFTHYPDVAQVISEGDTRSTVRLRAGLQVDLRVVLPESYGAALLYFTGSKPHNIVLRDMALERGWKINEYGVFEGEKRIAGSSEEEIYELLGLAYIPPELREDRGEIQAAAENRLPRLVTLKEIRGDLHAHSRASDGRSSLRDMAEAARKRGYEYLAVTDHSPRVAVAHGLDADRLARQIDEIDRLNEELDGITLLKGGEVDILEDGSLDQPDEILARLDMTVCSVHTAFSLSMEKQTERILRAMESPYFTILGHPTGRLIGRRQPYEVDLERVLKGARDNGCFVEINGQPERMDLDDVYSRMAKDLGVKLAITTDAHSPNELDYMSFGVDQARRGWLEKGDVLNTRGVKALLKLLKR